MSVSHISTIRIIWQSSFCETYYKAWIFGNSPTGVWKMRIFSSEHISFRTLKMSTHYSSENFDLVLDYSGTTKVVHFSHSNGFTLQHVKVLLKSVVNEGALVQCKQQQLFAAKDCYIRAWNSMNANLLKTYKTFSNSSPPLSEEVLYEYFVCLPKSI